MIKNLAYRALPVALIAAAGFALPTEAMAAIAQHASSAAQYLDEIVIGGVILGAVILFDTASWSFMTTKR